MDPTGRDALAVVEVNGEDIGPALWRVADLDLEAAEPALRALLDRKLPPLPKPPAQNRWRRRTPPSPYHWFQTPGRWQHAVVSALVRCGTPASIERLEQLIADSSTERNVRELAQLAIVRIAPDRAPALARPMLSLPIGDAAGALELKNPGELARLAEDLMSRGARDSIVALYLVDARPAVLTAVRVARLANTNEASIVRTLFRLGELRRDGELCALIARRIDSHVSGSPTWNGNRYVVGPFGPRTRGYFARRIARLLRRLGRVGSPDYVAMASAYLLAYSDDDAQPAREGEHSRRWYDRFARHHVLNDLLYGNSPRYERATYGKSVWCCVDPYRPGGPLPAVREERYPALWDAAPDRLWHLIRAGRATPVLEHATRALRPNRAYLEQLSDDEVGAALGTGHSIAQRFAFEIARDRPLSGALAAGALASDLDDAHTWAIDWVRDHPDAVAKDPYLIALLVTSKTARVREAAIGLARGRTLDPAVARSAAIRAIAMLISMPDAALDRATGAGETILAVLGEPLREVAVEILRDLIERSKALPPAGVLAGELMLRHAHRDALPAELIESLLASPHPAIRTFGGKLIATLPPEIAKDEPEALVAFALSSNPELREQTRTLIGEVARRWPDIGRAIAGQLIDALMTKQPDGAPAHVVSLLRGELAGCLPERQPETILKMIGALSPHAREAGGLLLGQLTPDDLSLDDLARLAHHEILSVRQGAWALARKSVDRYRIAPVAVSRLVDSPWEDTRAFAIEFVRSSLVPLPADAVIAICDSIRPQVQELGRSLLLAQLPADAGRYLLRLAEHPSPNIQLLVSGLLEQHLDSAERLRELSPYLIVVLSQVNRGAVAKQRVLELLRREATRSIEMASVIAPILARQSATIATSHKHPMIATMVELHTAFPEVELPIAIAAVPPVRRGGS